MTLDPRDTTGLNRFGHLTELSLNRLDEDEPASDPEFFRQAEAHLASCADCRETLNRKRSLDREIDIRPTLKLRLAWARDPRGERRRGWVGAGIAFALAASVFLLARPWVQPEPHDGIRAKGARFHLQVHVNDGHKTRLVGDGDVVYPGERVAFGVRAVEDGHLLIFGWDDSGKPYAIWPGGGSDAMKARSAPQPRSEHVVALPAAMRFDAIPGEEHLLAVFCPTPFGLAEIVPGGSVAGTPEVPAACVRRALVLRKTR